VYATFAAVTLLLHRLGAGCGCFGESRAPASPGQSALSAALAIVCGTAAFTHVHGAAWIVGRSPALAAVLVVGIIGAVFAIAATYSELPAAWEAWSGR
jgi:hypothetical protein